MKTAIIDAGAKCPTCNTPVGMMQKLTGQSGPAENGDFILCWTCKWWSVYENGQRRRPTYKEMIELAETVGNIPKSNSG